MKLKRTTKILQVKQSALGRKYTKLSRDILRLLQTGVEVTIPDNAEADAVLLLADGYAVIVEEKPVKDTKSKYLSKYKPAVKPPETEEE